MSRFKNMKNIKPKPKTGAKNARGGERIAPSDNAMNLRIAEIRSKLATIRQYKQVLERDGLEPDQEDKRRESELIVRLIRFEKILAGEVRKQPLPQGPKPTDDRRGRTRQR